MSKSSVVSAPKISASQLPTNAWAKGPPQTASPRSQSPAPSTPTSVHATHSRRPSTLGQGIPIKDGVSIPRNNVGATKTGSVVSFGSIDDASAPISSSPAATPAIKAPTEGVKSFGSVPATISQMNGKSSVSSSTKPPLSLASSSTSTSGASTSSASAPAKPGKMDIRKLFQNPSSSPSTSQSPSDTNSPSLRPINLPPQSQPSTSNAPMGQPPFTPFVPSGMRPPPNSTGPGVPSTPRSPNYSRQQMPNGNGPRPPNGVNTSGPPMQPPMGSPRLAPHPHPGQQPNMQPQPPVQMWAPYYYGLPPPDQPPYMYQPAPWGYGMSPQQMPPHPQQQHNLPHHPSSQGPPHPSMPMSPRNPPPQLQGGPPGTPTPSHASAVPHSPHPTPLTHTHSSSGSIGGVSSPPPTPSSATMPGSARLNPGTNAFVPRLTSKIIIKSADGSEVNLENLKKSQSHQPSPTVTSPPITSSPSGLLNSPSRRAIRIEDPEAKKKRQEKEKEEIQAKAAAAEKERQAKEEEEKKAREAKEAKEKAEEERLKKVKEEAERKEKERQEAERKVKEEAERKAKEEEEERLRIKAEEEEKQRLAEEERIREEKLRLEAEEKQRKEKEEEERRKEEEQARLRKEEEEAAIAAAAAEAAAAKAKAEEESKEEEQEEGEVIENDKPFTDDQEEKAGESKSEDKKSLRIDTTPAPEHLQRRRPGPLDLSSAAKPNIPAALPSALATARIIDDLGRVSYPEGVRSPKVELNVNAKDGKFRYDRDFLLQFMSICKEKPDHLPALDAIGLESSTQSFPMSRTQSGRGTRPPNSRTTSVNIGFAGGSNLKSGSNSSFTMGNFGTTAGSAGKTSEERYHASNPSNRAVSMTVAGGQFGGGRPGMQRTASTGGPGPSGSQPHGGRTRSKRGIQRPEANKPMPNYQQHNNHVTYGPGGIPLEPVAPLQLSENRWDRKAVSNVDPDSPELVDRKVKALLNKLTMEKFDSISDQIIAWANKSENQKDGRTLIQVIRLVFEKATDEAAWSEMYARLCRKMMEQISPKVQDDGIRNSDGKPITGGHLFRKYLLNRCQEDFERGWVNKEATAAAAATKASEDQAVKAAANGSKEEEEIALYSEEYYAAQKAKRQGLGLIKFIGELFKLQMLTERIMHECVKKLLGNVENPEEEEIESLCKLLTTVGQMLDTNKARAHMDVYFSRMKELTKSQNVTSRMQFMLQDIIELRERKWQTRNTVAAPTTIAKIHEAAAKEKAAQEKESQNRMASMSRGGSRRGADRNEQPNADGWTTTAPRPPAKVGDLSKFGQISKGAPMTFGPSSVFAGKKESKRESLSRTSSNANMFQMLQNVEAEAAAAAAAKTSRPPSRKTSIDLGSGGAPEPQRKRLILQPRTKPVDQDSAPAQESDSDEEDEVVDEAEQEMTEAEAKKKVAEDTKEFFAVRNLDEAEVYFSNLPSSHHRTLVDKLVSSAIESKEADATLVGNFFLRASSQKLCSPSEFEAGFLGITEFLDDIAIDAPKATDLLAIMIKGAGLSEEQRTNISSKSVENGEKLLKLSS